MGNAPNVIEAAIVEKTGIIQCKADPKKPDADWENVSPRVELFTSHVKGRVTLFLGSAISSFKPAKLPMWSKFTKLLWTSLLDKATSRDLKQRLMANVKGMADAEIKELNLFVAIVA